MTPIELFLKMLIQFLLWLKKIFDKNNIDYMAGIKIISDDLPFLFKYYIMVFLALVWDRNKKASNNNTQAIMLKFMLKRSSF